MLAICPKPIASIAAPSVVNSRKFDTVQQVFGALNLGSDRLGKAIARTFSPNVKTIPSNQPLYERSQRHY
jgi:hypothetical protein